MEEDISNFNQVILRQSNKSKNLKNKTEQHHNEQSRQKSTSIKTIMNNTIRIGVWNVQGSNTTQSASIINTVLDNNRLDAALLTGTNIKTNKIHSINKQYKNKITHHAPTDKTGQGVTNHHEHK
ncbi:hypothetical protein ACTFIY_011563 [Dictyostelium cf. discoideum]